LVKNGHLVAEGVNELHKRYDITAHAEIQAIRRAQKKMHTPVLSGYTMYASGEPCPMCLTAMYLVGVDRVYCGSSGVEDREGCVRLLYPARCAYLLCILSGWVAFITLLQLRRP